MSGGACVSRQWSFSVGTSFGRTFQARPNYNSAVTINAAPVGAERLPINIPD
jgi:hypothetical protein